MKQDWPIHDWKRLPADEQLLILSMLTHGWTSVWSWRNDSSVMLLNDRQKRKVFRLLDERCWWAEGLCFASLQDALSRRRGWSRTDRSALSIEVKMLIAWLCFWSAAFAIYWGIAWLS